jgi:hypothetical protein
MEVLFWGSLALILYAYVGYPSALAIVARLAPRPVRKRRFGADAPGVSIVVAARNEARRLPARIENLLAQELSGSEADHRCIGRLVGWHGGMRFCRSPIGSTSWRYRLPEKRWR